MKTFAGKLRAILKSRFFFWAVIVFFVVQALWYVFSAAYPMPFDEDFHYGIIQIYAEQWTPFLNGQLAEADTYGAITRDPSYLFHYIMSFPYRLLALFSNNEAFLVISLRLTNVALFTGGLLFFRKLLLQKFAISIALTNVIFAVFTLVPIVPHLAATINYDNLFFLLLPLLFILTHDILSSLQHRRIALVNLCLFAILSMILSLIKYAALPILTGLVIFVIVYAITSFRSDINRLPKVFAQTARKIPHRTTAGLAIAFIITLGLFIQRYGVNIVEYNALIPDCSKVLSTERCMAYGPWARNYELSQAPNTSTNTSPVVFMGKWLEGMHHRSFFALGGPTTDYDTTFQLPVPSIAAIVLAVTGVVFSMVYARQIFTEQALLQAIMTATIVYLAILWAQLYMSYVQTGEPLAINGRYLIPLLIPIGVVFGLAFHYAMKKRQALKSYAAAFTILCFLWGGGTFTYIVRHEPAWLWPNETVRQINAAAQKVISPIVIK